MKSEMLPGPLVHRSYQYMIQTPVKLHLVVFPSTTEHALLVSAILFF